MSPLLRSGRRALAGSVLSILCSLPAGVTAGQNPFKWMFGADKTNYQTFKDPAGRFELEYPTKDWRVLPASGGSTLAVFTRNDGPALLVDGVRLTERLTPGEIEAMPESELDRLKRLEPQSKDFQSEMLDTKAGRGVLIKFSRAGKEIESVLQCAVSVDKELYRLNAVVPQKLFSKYQQTMVHMIQSFKAPVDPSTPKD